MIRMLHEYIGDEVEILFFVFVFLLHSSLFTTFHDIEGKDTSNKNTL